MKQFLLTLAIAITAIAKGQGLVANSFSYYPNPTTEILNVVPTVDGLISYQLINLDRMEAVHDSTLPVTSGNRFTINTQNLPQGAYRLVIYVDNIYAGGSNIIVINSTIVE